MFAVPEATAVITPEDPTVAIAGLSDAQTASRLMICVLPSSNDPVAVSVNLVAGAIVLLAGVTEMDTT
jgi:NhaP-type Na+/H+ or K+/H+ antiporter